MENKIDVDKIDERLRKEGWRFFGPILHYQNALKDQASIYEKDGKFIVSGIDKSGEKELNEPITKEEAEKRVEESLEEIKNYVFGK